MIDDQEQLEADLRFSPRKTFSGRTVRGPLGATAITAFGLVYTLLLWGVTVAIASQTQANSGLGAVLWLLVMGAEMFVAGSLAQGTWKAIGPVPRTVLRPLMILGPWPFLIATGLAFAMGVGLVRGAISGELFKPELLEGQNWKVFRLDRRERNGVTASQAEVRCRELGDGWRVPSPNDYAAMQPKFEGHTRTLFWATDASGPQLTEWSCQPLPCGQKWSRPVGSDFTAYVVCFRGP